MKKQIKDIAEIQIGYQPRGKIKADLYGNYHVIQVKDFKERDQLEAANLVKILVDSNVDRYLIKKGDVLFQAKGANNFAYPIVSDLVDTIAVSTFLILRLRILEIHPDYLAWYINQYPAQAELDSRSRGSYVPLIPKGAFETLEIKFPDIDHQRKIVKAAELQRKEQELAAQLTEKRKILVQKVCLKSIKHN